MKHCRWFFAAIITAAFVGCTMEPDAVEPPGPDPIPGNPTGGPVTKYADGWASTPAWYFMTIYPGPPGEQVSVTLSLENGFITNLSFSAEPRETFGEEWVFARAYAQIMQYNSFEQMRWGLPPLPIDVFSGGTYTARAIRDAGRAAIQSIIDGAE